MDYKEKLRLAKEALDSGSYDRGTIEYIFPELAESEDGRIRNFLINTFKSYQNSEIHIDPYNWEGVKISTILAWLERQSNLITELQKAYAEIGRLVKENYYLKKKQGEQKLTDTVEPKFHKGDWVVTDKNNVVQIKAIEDSKYVLENTMRFSVDYVNKCWRKWTIQDAKDGDVLTYNDSKNNVYVCIFKEYANERIYDYCTLDKESFWEYGNWNYLASFSYTPATKEQRDTLEKAMNNAGYVFDFEKKELKKIENEIEISFGAKDSELQEATYYIPKGFHAEIEGNNVTIKKGEQKPVDWSEEDEVMRNFIIRIFEVEHPDGLFCAGYFKDKLQNDAIPVKRIIDWLNSIRPQKHWKPSDEQMEALEHFVRSIGESGYASPYDNNTKLLYSLLSDLKKLKEQLKKL